MLEINMNLEKLSSQINENPELALAELNLLLKDKLDKDLLILRSQVHQKMNRLTDALNDCIDFLGHFGHDEKVFQQKLYLENIIKMSQLDVYACTNLHIDPWD
jgi:hypothetical protein